MLAVVLGCSFVLLSCAGGTKTGEASTIIYIETPPTDQREYYRNGCRRHVHTQQHRNSHFFFFSFFFFFKKWNGKKSVCRGEKMMTSSNRPTDSLFLFRLTATEK